MGLAAQNSCGTLCKRLLAAPHTLQPMLAGTYLPARPVKHPHVAHRPALRGTNRRESVTSTEPWKPVISARVGHRVHEARFALALRFTTEVTNAVCQFVRVTRPGASKRDKGFAGRLVS